MLGGLSCSASGDGRPQTAARDADALALARDRARGQGAGQGRQQRGGLGRDRDRAGDRRRLEQGSVADLRRPGAGCDRAQLRRQAGRQAAAAGIGGAAAARRGAQLAQLPLGARDLLVRGRHGDDPGRAVRSACLRSRACPVAGAPLSGDALSVRRPGRRRARRPPRPDRAALAVKVGIVGLPNAGKSTLFNALTKGGAQTGDYPFTTIEPNVAIAQVPDERLERAAETGGSSELVPATIAFHAIAGLVKGASEGEGLGNQFLASIRGPDAICHVVRCHADTGVPHPDGRVDPLADIETIETELMLADYEQTERRLERVSKQAKSGDAEAAAERDWLEAVYAALAAGRPARSIPVPEAAPGAERRLQALTSKPILYVANVDEGDSDAPGAVVRHAAASDAGVVAVSARIEGELAELDPAEAEEMRESYGVEGSGLARLVRAAYDLLDLLTFFTAGEGKEAVARPLPRGATAWEAAGTIHTEIQEAFVKAEVIGWKQLVECGGYVPARDRGLLRIEGRDYVVQDGDVITIKV